MLSADEYLDDFWPRFERIEDYFWKLERRQHFREPGNPSWEAAVAGDWDRALALIGQTRQSAAEHYRRIADLGFEGRRVRVVELPPSPYVQWSMRALKVRVEAGERTRVVLASEIADRERDRPLPEIVILGRATMYEVLYDDTGTLTGARRVDDHRMIAACRAELADLYAHSEEFMCFFDRQIRPLSPLACLPG
ncbi:MAG: hypothetical protein GEU94_15605 [Micromonosporaceae bacterium]|nr:hypothetical protein [Micromonosporaceae bacterium]